ncbi:sulfurtransferase [Croceicoccus estronivorus]|uniref:rhodanese-like domain-containing protein n=1 Tax=Croceicoccus estronivorus TaxID=1172626 RepID=UPI0008335F0C|nr:rhodanese-like domain-containing protein [Croceicoccus estronivorus]OCC24208.1 sulfurtransferase [Croceicoccus estronivorus]
MVFGFGKSKHQEINAQELDAMLRDGSALVVDVREPDEFAAGHIPGAVNLPLSRFSPDELPDPQGRQLVLNCLGGKRSGMALDKCGIAKANVDTHLAGGFNAWQAARLPVER